MWFSGKLISSHIFSQSTGFYLALISIVKKSIFFSKIRLAGIMIKRHKTVTEIIIAALFISYLLFVVFLGAKYNFKVPEVQPEQFSEWVDQNQPLIINLCEKKELLQYPLRYQPMLNLPFLSIEKRLKKIQLPTNRKILIVCSDGNRSRYVATLLTERGISCYFLKSGIQKLNFRNSHSRQVIR